MRTLITLFILSVLLATVFIACKKTDDIQPPPVNPPRTDTTRTGTDTTHTGTDTTHTDTTHTGGDTIAIKVDTVIVATPSAVLITTHSMDTAILEWGNLFTYDIRLESYTGNYIKVAFHPKSKATTTNENPDYPLSDQVLIYKDTPDKGVLDNYTLKDTAYTHWEMYNKQQDTLLYIILVHDKSFIGSPEFIYRLANRAASDPFATSEEAKEAIEKNDYGILNWDFAH